MILVVSSEDDEHALAVLEHTGEERTTLLDLAAFPQAAQLSVDYDPASGHEHRLTTDSGRLSFDEYDVVWWRRPQPFRLHRELVTGVDRNFAYTESREAFDGLWLVLDAFWVNHPTRHEEAAHKVYQLSVAQDVGFEIPETRVTNDPDAAMAFVDEHGPESTVYKAFSATERAWRETRVLEPEETAVLEDVEFAPVIFQEYIPADVDLRVTVVGDDVFAAAIHSRETAYPVDFRMQMDEARMEPFELPEGVSDRIHELMDQFGLAYGAIDVRRTPDGRFVFLEINPAGQWLFVEERTGQPITRAVADLLVANDR